jgi:hypothetical protein
MDQNQAKAESKAQSRLGRVALMWRGDPTTAPARREEADFRLLWDGLASEGVEAEGVVYSDEAVKAVRDRLLACDGVVVWVNPIAEEGDRSTLDPMLREIADRGVWVSTHPEVILKMGTKEVLFTTRTLGWGTDVCRYLTEVEFRDGLPRKLMEGPRVLKQQRGNGGIGVWKVERLEPNDTPPTEAESVRTLHARRGSAERVLPLGDFMDRCARFFANGGMIIDQAFQPRLPEGMIRCYLVQGEVAGFGQQLIKALVPPPPSGPDSPEALPGPRIMHPPEAPEFQKLRHSMEQEWVPALRKVLDIEARDLPMLWDADFLFGPKDANGDDTYVLCEINVSAVAPFPESAATPLANAIAARLRDDKASGY